MSSFGKCGIRIETTCQKFLPYDGDKRWLIHKTLSSRILSTVFTISTVSAVAIHQTFKEKTGWTKWLMMDGQRNNLKATEVVVDTNNRWRWDNRHDCPQIYSLIDWTTESRGWRFNGYKILMESIEPLKFIWSWTRLWHGTLEQSNGSFMLLFHAEL